MIVSRDGNAVSAANPMVVKKRRQTARSIDEHGVRPNRARLALVTMHHPRLFEIGGFVVLHHRSPTLVGMQDLAGEPDPFRVVGRLNSMPIEQIARPGTMMGCDREPAPGPIWASIAEVYRGWTACPWPQIHGHTTAWRQKFGWSQFLPNHLQNRCTADRGHVTFVPSEGSRPIIGIDPALWDRSPLGSLRPLVFSTKPAVVETMAAP